MALLRDLVPGVPESVAEREVARYWLLPTEAAARARAEWEGELGSGLLWVCPVVCTDDGPREWGVFELLTQQEVCRWR